MAFAVFSDSTAAPQRSSQARTRTSSGSSRRALEGLSAKAPLAGHVNVPFNGKENYDPFCSLPGGKGKSVLGAKKVLSQPPVRALAPSSTTNLTSSGIGSGLIQPKSASQGICTGTMRVRELPASVWGGSAEPRAKSGASSSSSAGGKRRMTSTQELKLQQTRARPAGLLIKRATKLSEADLEEALPSPASVADSGYGSAGLGRFADEGEDEDAWSEEERVGEVKGSRRGGMKLVEGSPRESAGDRSASKSPVSPLAELTEAFESQRTFSPTPYLTKCTRSSRPSQASPTKSLKPTSRSALGGSASAARLRPYVSPKKASTRARAPSMRM